MMSFFSSLINRHTLMDNVVKPRFITIFEAENISANTGSFNEFFTRDFTSKRQAADDQFDSLIENNVMAGDKIGPVDKIKQAKPHTNPNEAKPKNNKEDSNSVLSLTIGGTLDSERVPWLPALPKNSAKPGANKISEQVVPMPTISIAGEMKIKDTHFPIEDSGKNHEQTRVNVFKETSLDSMNESLINTTVDTIKGSKETNTDLPENHLFNQAEHNHDITVNPAFPVQNQEQSSYFKQSLKFKTTPQGETSKAVVKITIGQIDIKAIHDVPQSATVKSKTAEAPRMSLDDYLKTRNSN